uniref:Uncharacterized protein n=1 Tax=Aegilops tauschii TaxID=37682 RepID=M8BQI8_AEGTA
MAARRRVPSGSEESPVVAGAAADSDKASKRDAGHARAAEASTTGARPYELVVGRREATEGI